jgi:hypothetical protein
LTSHSSLGTVEPFTIRCGHSLMVKLQPSKLAMRVRFPLPAHSFSHWWTDVNKRCWTLSDVLTISSDQYGINHKGHTPTA